jgi:hypothetical protein
MAFLPVILLAAFVLFSLLPTMFGDNTPDPGYTFRPTNRFSQERHTLPRNVNYYVNPTEWEGSAVWQSVPEQYRQRKDAAQFSSRLKNFEFGVEQTQISHLQAEVSPRASDVCFIRWPAHTSAALSTMCASARLPRRRACLGGEQTTARSATCARRRIHRVSSCGNGA